MTGSDKLRPKSAFPQQLHWVRAEAGEGLNREVLVPALIDDVQPPIVFRLVQAEHLTDWFGALSPPWPRPPAGDHCRASATETAGRKNCRACRKGHLSGRVHRAAGNYVT
ncbi:MAG: hypothetical protein ACXW1N_07700 [Halobacteriota archaeon]